MAFQIGKMARVKVENSPDVVADPPGQAACDNPLLNNVILSNMFKFVDFEQLGQCRRVSTHWFKGSLPAWQTKAPVIGLRLNPNPDSDEEEEEELPSLRSDMLTFLRLFRNEFHSYGPYEYCGLRQYTKSHLAGNACDPVQHHFLQQFLRSYGPFVTELKLDLVIPDFDTYRATMLSTMSPNLAKLVASIKVRAKVLRHGIYELMQEDHTKLTSLQVSFQNLRRDDVSRLPLAGWTRLLNRYPNLKTLLLAGPDFLNMEAANKKALKAIGNIRSSDKKRLDLRSLKISLEGTSHDQTSLAPLFRNAQLSLETLEIFLDGETLHGMYEVLSSQAATLKKLSIHAEAVLDNFEPPELPFVENLELRGQEIKSLNPFQRFQKLKSLSIINTTFGGSFQDTFPQIVRNTDERLILPSLTKFHFLHDGNVRLVCGPLGSEDVRKMQGFFPNLEDLQLWLDNHTLRAVVQCFPDLQHLTIMGYEVDDAGISHIAPYLPGLKSLVMRNAYLHGIGPTALTETSLVRFLELPNLETLEITLDDELSVDSDIFLQLEEKMKNFKLTWA